MTSEEIYRKAAYHKAGHAVVHHFLQRQTEHREPIESVYIYLSPTGEPVGGCVSIDRTQDGFAIGRAARRYRGWLEDTITVIFAGPEAERIITGEYCLEGLDRKYLRELTRYFRRYQEQSRLEQRAFLRWLRLRAQSMLQRPNIRSCVDAVANALMDQRQFTETELISIICDTEAKESAKRVDKTSVQGYPAP